MSGLPSGYTQLEYIQSSGTQWIDTGFKPNQNTRIKMDCNVIGFNSEDAFLFGARIASGNTAFCLAADDANTRWFALYGNAVQNPTGTCTGKHSIDFNQNVLTLDGKNFTFAKTTFQSSYNLLLFATITNGNVDSQRGKMAIYSCQIYDNGNLIRDFVPCVDPTGNAGLYDVVSGQFYGNAGTGTFTAGPEVVYEPDAPTNFAASVSGQTVALSWAASANAAGYRLKRDGVQIADQTGTTYTDTVPDGTTLCTYALTAYNDAGESAAAALTVILRLDLITDRTRADVVNQTDKGFYNASDLNRVGAAVEYIAGRFTALGYACPVTVKKDWLTSDAPTASQMETYRQNIVTLRGQIAVMASTPEATASMAGLNYVKANNIEQILLDLDVLITNITKSWCFSGELYAGEV